MLATTRRHSTELPEETCNPPAPALVGVKEGFIAKSLGGAKLSTQAFNAGPFGGSPANQECQEGLCPGS